MVKTHSEHDSSAQATAARARTRRRPRRRGISIFWVLLFVPVFVILLGIVVNVANLWLARVELENGLESAALAAVKEWVENGPQTDNARLAGVRYAAANCVRGRPLDICGNLGSVSGTNPNANYTCCVGKEDLCTGADPSGNLIFGAITTDDPNCPITFNAGLEPGCGGGSGTVLLDTLASLDSDHHNQWGIAFIGGVGVPSDLRIRTVVIDLRTGGGTGEFNSAPALSGNTPGQWAVGLPGGPSQADIWGFNTYVANGSSGQIRFFLDTPYRLRIEFTGDGTDGGFEPCDRFRFGIKVKGVSSGPFKDDADGIGDDAVGITVVFEQGPVGAPTSTFTRTGTYVNRCERTCRSTALYYASCNSPPGDLIVNPETTSQFPQGIPNLPCPAASGENCNTDQSWALVSAGSGRPFAVRAQAVVPVCSPWSNIFGINFGTSYVTGCVTAVYDCSQPRPRLVRVDRYLCPGP